MVRIPPRTRDLLEVILAYSLILIVIWIPNPLQRILYWITFAIVITLTLLRRESLTTLGLGTTGILRSLWVVGVALLLALLAMGLAFRLHTLHSLFGRAPVVTHAWGYFIWAIMQQFLLQSYFLLRLLRLTSKLWLAVAIATLLFAVAHIPNPVLILLTLIWGLISCLLFLRYRNIYTLGIAHGILGICLAITIPDHIHRHMRVGLGYLHYHSHTWRGLH
jgi:membrane protease YdiL (CAAX protease family)